MLCTCFHSDASGAPHRAGLPDGVRHNESALVGEAEIPGECHGIDDVAAVEQQDRRSIGRSCEQDLCPPVASLDPVRFQVDGHPLHGVSVGRGDLSSSRLSSMDRRPGVGED